MFLFYCIIFFIHFLLFEKAPPQLDVSFMVEVLLLNSILVIGSLIYFFRRPDFRQNIVRHSVFFLIGFCIVHFQYYIVYIITGQIDSVIDIWVDESVVCKSFSLSSLGLTSFFVGYFFALKGGPSKKRIIKIYSYKGLTWIALVVFVLFLMTVDSSYLMGEYRRGVVFGIAIYLQLFLDLLIGSIIIIHGLRLSGDSKSQISFLNYLKKFGWLFILLTLSYMGLMIFVGERSSIIFISLLVVGGYGFLRKVWLKTIPVIVIILLGSVIMSLTGEIRKYDKSIPYFDRMMIVLNNSESGVIAPTDELASSVRTIHYAVSYVPEQYDYTYGRFAIQQIVAILPGLGQFVFNSFNGNYQYKNSASFITFLEQGPFPLSGTGTSCIADLYIEFGVIGVVFGMFCFGFVMRKFEIAAFSNKLPSLLVWVFTMVYFARSIYIARSSIFLSIKECVTIYILIILNNYIMSKFVRHD